MTYHKTIFETKLEPEQEPKLEPETELETEPELELEQEPKLTPKPTPEPETRLRKIVHLTIEIPTEIIQPYITGIRRHCDIIKHVSMF